MIPWDVLIPVASSAASLALGYYLRGKLKGKPPAPRDAWTEIDRKIDQEIKKK